MANKSKQRGNSNDDQQRPLRTQSQQPGHQDEMVPALISTREGHVGRDIGDQRVCGSTVQQTVKELGRLDVLVNNAAEQHPQKDFSRTGEEQLIATFRTNLISMFYLCQAALPHLRKQPGSSIINTTSVTVYRGSPGVIDYSHVMGGYAGGQAEYLRVPFADVGPVAQFAIQIA